MLDMSKAFDTVNRPKLITILRTILTPTELYMMHLLIDDVILNVKVGDTFGEDILTMIGICQGDCLSAILLIVYLAYVLKPLPQMAERIDHTETLWSASLTSSIEWKKCKCLRSLLGTEEDIKRGKGLTISSYNSYEDIFCSRRISEKVRLRAFEQYIGKCSPHNSLDSH